jgi:hypothetical protein
MSFRPYLLPMTVGSLPHREVGIAWELMLTHTPQLPAWPQLPRRTFLENMYVQYSERFPGLVLDREQERIWVDREADLSSGLEGLYTAYLEGDLSYGAISGDYAAGLAALPGERLGQALAIKGHVTGPVSWGLTVTDRHRRPTLYDEVLADAIARHLKLKALWQERLLRRFNPNTIIFIDEPYMSSFGSAYVSLGREQVITLMEEVLDGIQGLKGVHCCGNTDWSILLSTPIDILSLDAYGYAENLALYPEALSAFLARGGIIAWGIVPNSPEVEQETVHSLVARLEAGMGRLARKGIPLDDLLQAALITPACGLGPRTVAQAERGLALMAGVSAAMRARYLGERTAATPAEAGS